MHLEKSGFVSLNLNVLRTVKEDKEEEEEKELQKKQLFSLKVHLDERNAFVFFEFEGTGAEDGEEGGGGGGGGVG